MKARGPLGSHTVKLSSSLAGECSKPRTKPRTSSRSGQTNQDRYVNPGFRAGKPGTLTHAITISGWMPSKSCGKSQWRNNKGGSWGSGTKPCYLQWRIMHLLKYNCWHVNGALLETERLTMGGMANTSQFAQDFPRLSVLTLKVFYHGKSLSPALTDSHPKHRILSYQALSIRDWVLSHPSHQKVGRTQQQPIIRWT